MAESTRSPHPQTGAQRPEETTRSGLCFSPNVDILEKADELIVEADIPGARQDAIDVDFEDGLLTIHARIEPRQPPNTEYRIHEYGLGDFHRAFRVSEAVDASRISAEYVDGVLVLHLPKAEQAKPRKIVVRS
jgi:HSP20 family molecular chaperone IbpA